MSKYESNPESETACGPETLSSLKQWGSKVPKESQQQGVLSPISNIFPYSWYQTDEKVVMEIKKQVSGPQHIKIVFDNKQVLLKMRDKFDHLSDGVVALFAEIQPAQSKFTLGLLSVTLEMPKKKSHEPWPRLEMSSFEAETFQGPKPIGNVQGVESGSYYPSSSRVKKDWSKLDKELEKDLKKEGALDEGDPSMKFFREIFANADPETQKAMMKSYQTSGGTVLYSFSSILLKTLSFFL